MSPLTLVTPLATFVFFSGFAAAQISAPTSCSTTFEWTANSLSQNPCTVAARLMATCSGGTYTLNALTPGQKYAVAPHTIANSSDLCKCNTVTYSLLSACDACQGEDWISWSEYSATCKETLPPSSFPNSVPSGTRVPQWALIDVTSEITWDLNKASAVGDLPEQAPGAKIGTPKSSSNSTNTDVIIGGVVGGVTIISLVVAIGFFLQRRRRQRAASVAPPVVGASQPPMDEIQQPSTMDYEYTGSYITGTNGSSSMPGTHLTPMTNDQDPLSTLPGYQGTPQAPTTPLHGAVPSPNGLGTRNSLVTLQTSGNQGYFRLATV